MGLIHRVLGLLRRKRSRGDASPAAYWTRHNVTGHRRFRSAGESLDEFLWRNDQYFGYIDLMPVSGQDDRIVLDYGCGPGHDLVGFGHYSKPAKLIGIDVSPTSVEEARRRLALHDDIRAEITLIGETEKELPLESGSIDYIHSSGVLHHVPDLSRILGEFRRIIRPGGCARIMIYNYNSLWLHLYVAYIKMIYEGRYSGLDIMEAFGRTTDGEKCPISIAYRPEEFSALASEAGFDCEFLGAAISMQEMSIFGRRFAAIQDRRLRRESRSFLLELEVDRFGLPRHRGVRAGIDGCYRMRPRP